jgi:hypothetical protein
MLDLFRQVNWIVFFPHGLLLAIFAVLINLTGTSWDVSILAGAVIYLGLSTLLQRFVPFHHRHGMSLLVQRDYERASQAFQASWEFFNKKSWLDDYRAIFILSASKMSYREMALINRSLCYWQMGEDAKARESYVEVLKYFPDSKMAKDGIAYIDNPEPEEEEEEEKMDESF